METQTHHAPEANNFFRKYTESESTRLRRSLRESARRRPRRLEENARSIPARIRHCRFPAWSLHRAGSSSLAPGIRPRRRRPMAAGEPPPRYLSPAAPLDKSAGTPSLGIVARRDMSTDRLEILRTMLAQNPQDSFARYGLAMEYSKRGDLETAVTEFKILLEHNPDYA